MSLQQGTRIFKAPSGTAWTPLAAAANPAGTFVQITGGINARVVPHEVEKFDAAPLEAIAPQPDRTLKPGTMTFGMEEHATQSVTLRGICEAGTKFVWVFLYLDGTADTVTGRLCCTSGGEANKGDFKAKVPETYQVDGDTVVTRQPAA